LAASLARSLGTAIFGVRAMAVGLDRAVARGAGIAAGWFGTLSVLNELTEQFAPSWWLVVLFTRTVVLL